MNTYNVGETVLNLEGDWRYKVLAIEPNGNLALAPIANLRLNIQFEVRALKVCRDVEPEAVRPDWRAT